MRDLGQQIRPRRATGRTVRQDRPGRVRGLLVAGSGLELEVPGWEAGEEIDLNEGLPFALQSLMGHRQTMTLWRRDDLPCQLYL